MAIFCMIQELMGRTETIYMFSGEECILGKRLLYLGADGTVRVYEWLRPEAIISRITSDFKDICGKMYD